MKCARGWSVCKIEAVVVGLRGLRRALAGVASRDAEHQRGAHGQRDHCGVRREHIVESAVDRRQQPVCRASARSIRSAPAGACHTSRSAMAASPPARHARTGCSARGHRRLTEPADNRTVGVLSPPMPGPRRGAATLDVPARSPRRIRRWMLRRRKRDNRPSPALCLPLASGCCTFVRTGRRRGSNARREVTTHWAV